MTPGKGRKRVERQVFSDADNEIIFELVDDDGGESRSSSSSDEERDGHQEENPSATSQLVWNGSPFPQNSTWSCCRERWNVTLKIENICLGLLLRLYKTDCQLRSCCDRQWRTQLNWMVANRWLFKSRNVVFSRDSTDCSCGPRTYELDIFVTVWT